MRASQVYNIARIKLYLLYMYIYISAEEISYKRIWNILFNVKVMHLITPIE